MVKSGSRASSCKPESAVGTCCRIEALISVDERGQMVLPKEFRERANIKAGDKLAVISWGKDSEMCCLTLIKADNLAGQVREFLGPIMSKIGGIEK